MPLLYSNVPPMRLKPDEKTLIDYISDSMKLTDTVYIAVGYVSKKALLEFDELVHANNIPRIVLMLGMYCVDGFLEGIYNIDYKYYILCKSELTKIR